MITIHLQAESNTTSNNPDTRARTRSPHGNSVTPKSTGTPEEHVSSCKFQVGCVGTTSDSRSRQWALYIGVVVLVFLLMMACSLGFFYLGKSKAEGDCTTAALSDDDCDFCMNRCNCFCQSMTSS